MYMCIVGQEYWSWVIWLMCDLPCKMNLERGGLSESGEPRSNRHHSKSRHSSKFYLTICFYYLNLFKRLFEPLLSPVRDLNSLNRVIRSASLQAFHSVNIKFSNILELSSRASCAVGFVPSLVKVLGIWLTSSDPVYLSSGQGANVSTQHVLCIMY